MRFQNTKIPGAFVIELDPKMDERGSLSRIWDHQTFLSEGMDLNFKEGYITSSRTKGTMRGIHFQVPPKAESKLTRVLCGAVYEVVVDLRRDSPSYKEAEGFELRESDHKMLLIPENCGHGILTLEDDTALISFATAEYSSEHERGIRYDDNGFNFLWPVAVNIVSTKDSAWKDFQG